MNRSRHPLLALVLTAILTGMPARAEGPPLREVIDARIAAAWQEQGITSVGLASDAEFLRRASLDLGGVIPTYEETVAFLADASPDKRSRLIDRLLDGPRYAQHQADVWDMILFGRRPPGYGTDQRNGFQRWLREQFAQNRPYDEWVRELLRGAGNSVEQGPPLYYVQYRGQPEDLTEVVAQTFLGVQLQCARCHDHPFEPWKQLDFYGMAAFFALLNIVEAGSQDDQTLYVLGEKSTGELLFTGPAQDQAPGQQGEPVKPRFLLGEAMVEPPLPEGFQEPTVTSGAPPPAPVFSRKDQLVDWLVRAENPFFARAIANRLWAQLMGRGLVHPVDNMSASNTPSHPELLDALAAWLVEQRFDVRGYFRELANSRVYQLSSSGARDEAQALWFEHARWRPLSAEELVESWRVATGYDAATTVQATAEPRGRFYPLEGGYVLLFFGEPNNGVGEFQGGLNEHLYLNNGELGRLIVTEPGSLYAALAQQETPWDARVERLFLQVLNRPPTVEERQQFVALLAAEQDPSVRLRDAIWALMTCSEFRFNH
jgi:hypothetical protein